MDPKTTVVRGDGRLRSASHSERPPQSSASTKAAPAGWAVAFVTLAGSIIWTVATAWPEQGRTDVLVLATFVPQVAMSVVFVCSEFKRRPYSLHLMHGLFTFMFFGVAALAQFLCRRFPLSDFYPVTFSDAEVVWTNAIVTAWLVSYYLGHRFMPNGQNDTKGHPLVVTQFGLFLGGVLSVLALAFLAARGSFGVLTRGGFDEVVGVGSGTESLVIGVLVRGLPIVTALAFTAAAVESKQRRARNAIA
jgi:hypothetical protein